MKKCLLATIIMISFIFLPTLLMAQPGNFSTSLHATREGKVTFYNQANGGFEALTGIPMASLSCLGCHPGTYANGDPVDPATYVPGCNDCHVVPGDQPTDAICRKCHSRQATEINKLGLTDVHRDNLGFTCMSCHGTEDVHGDGTVYNSMLEPGAMDADCQNAGCHVQLASNPEHDQHANDIHCATCHTQTVIACYNCHFNSLLQAEIKRAYKPLNGFILMGTHSKYNKIYPASFQSLFYKTDTGQDTSFYTLAPYYSHSVTVNGRTCADCHNNANVQAYNSSGELWIGKWDDTQNTLTSISGVVPIPPDWNTAFKMDFITYNGRIDTSFTDPTQWSFVETGPDLAQNLGYIIPLTTDQMNDLSTPVSIGEDPETVVADYALLQNFPNPFNPSTTIEFRLAHQTWVTLRVFNVLGEEVATLLKDTPMNAGSHSVVFKANHLASGVYMYRLDTPDFSAVKKMVVMK